MEEPQASPITPIWDNLQAEFRKALGIPEFIDAVHDLVPAALKEAYDKGYADALEPVGTKKWE